MSLSIDQLESLAALERMEPEWRELWERDPAATPFESPATRLFLRPRAELSARAPWMNLLEPRRHTNEGFIRVHSRLI